MTPIPIVPQIPKGTDPRIPDPNPQVPDTLNWFTGKWIPLGLLVVVQSLGHNNIV